ncbi:MAG TPA: HD domain-containing phosphohydrolase [Candidatus Dormibacteraeota bacterium]
MSILKPAAAGANSGVELAEVVAAVALATDLGLGQPLEHLLRTCLIATRFADRLGASQEDRDATYWVALFMIAGCTAISFEMSQMFGDDIDFRRGLYSVPASTLHQIRYMFRRAGSNRSPLGRAGVSIRLMASRMTSLEQALLAHCAVSVRLAERLGLGGAVVASLRQTFTRWDGRGIPRGVGGGQLLLPIRIVHIANIVEERDRTRGVEASIARAQEFSGTSFDPALVSAWSASADEVLDGVDAESAWERVVSSQPGGREPLTEAELDDALALLGDYADLKSPWFTGHSRGVASLAAAAARAAGAPERDVKTLRRAALVHDIGRNGVPNTVWDKPGRFTEAEMERARLHAYYTERVLHRASRLSLLAGVAAAAHERSGGGGYPRRITGAAIPFTARILAAADAYHAMLEERPHRPALSRERAASELRNAARLSELDGAAVDAVLGAAGHRTRRKPSAPAGLTPRELEVLALVARGSTTRAMGVSLGIAPKTAEHHIENIYSKTGISSRAEAALFAMQQGLVRDWETTET